MGCENARYAQRNFALVLQFTNIVMDVCPGEGAPNGPRDVVCIAASPFPRSILFGALSGAKGTIRGLWHARLTWNHH
jgi:hypothetical protein